MHLLSLLYSFWNKSSLVVYLVFIIGINLPYDNLLVFLIVK